MSLKFALWEFANWKSVSWQFTHNSISCELEVCFGSFQVDELKVCKSEVLHIESLHVGIFVSWKSLILCFEICKLKVCELKICKLEVCMLEVDDLKVCQLEVCMLKVWKFASWKFIC